MDYAVNLAVITMPSNQAGFRKSPIQVQRVLIALALISDHDAEAF
jgi:hypothetical protein